MPRWDGESSSMEIAERQHGYDRYLEGEGPGEPGEEDELRLKEWDFLTGIERALKFPDLCCVCRKPIFSFTRIRCDYCEEKFQAAVAANHKDLGL